MMCISQIIMLYTLNLYSCCLVAKSCLTLCDHMDCGLPGVSVHGISQARILEWVAISFPKTYTVLYVSYT